MKLALLSDVHGNLEALDAVLRDVAERHPGARLLCAGDIVGYGPDPEACIDRLRERGAACVMGNHEEMVLGRRDFSDCVYAGITAAVWTRRKLTAPAREYLERLPRSIEPEPGVIVCHGNLEDANNYVSNPEQGAAALDQLRRLHPRARLLIVGHTHHAALSTPARGFRTVTAPGEHDLDGDGPWLVNPGSVGQARDGKTLARYAVLDTDRKRVAFFDIAYDHDATIRKLREAGLVAQVVLTRPRGFGRWLERWKTRWARHRAGP